MICNTKQFRQIRYCLIVSLQSGIVLNFTMGEVFLSQKKCLAQRLVRSKVFFKIGEPKPKSCAYYEKLKPKQCPM